LEASIIIEVWRRRLKEDSVLATKSRSNSWRGKSLYHPCWFKCILNVGSLLVDIENFWNSYVATSYITLQWYQSHGYILRCILATRTAWMIICFVFCVVVKPLAWQMQVLVFLVRLEKPIAWQMQYLLSWFFPLAWDSLFWFHWMIHLLWSSFCDVLR